MKREQGFSLIELLIVVAIIAIIAAIAVPSLLTSRMSANEASAAQGCRTIGSGEMAFAATNNQNFTTLEILATNRFIDSRYAVAGGGGMNGYSYAEGAVVAVPAQVFGAIPEGFQFLATPGTNMGRFIYGIAEDMVVRFEGLANGGAYPPNTVQGSPLGRLAAVAP
jgi:prepilin-type N-terminal cleavage/methylation domain-containing protein